MIDIWFQCCASALWTQGYKTTIAGNVAIISFCYCDNNDGRKTTEISPLKTRPVIYSQRLLKPPWWGWRSRERNKWNKTTIFESDLNCPKSALYFFSSLFHKHIYIVLNNCVKWHIKTPADWSRDALHSLTHLHSCQSEAAGLNSDQASFD